MFAFFFLFSVRFAWEENKVNRKNPPHNKQNLKFHFQPTVLMFSFSFYYRHLPYIKNETTPGLCDCVNVLVGL